MAFSYQEEVSNGVQTVYAIDFDFRNTETIYVYTGEHSGYATQLSWRFTNFNTQIELTNLSEVPSGTKFYIRRIVDRANLSYVFENKSMRGKFVDEQNYATLYLLQELMDGFSDLSVAQPVPLGLNMLGNIIHNLGEGVAETDAATIGQVIAAAEGGRGRRIVTQTISEIPNRSALPEGTSWHVVESNRDFTLQEGVWVEDNTLVSGLGANFVTETAENVPQGAVNGSKWFVTSTEQEFIYLVLGVSHAVWTERSQTIVANFDTSSLKTYTDDAEASANGLGKGTVYKTPTGELRYKL